MKSFREMLRYPVPNQYIAMVCIGLLIFAPADRSTVRMAVFAFLGVAAMRFLFEGTKPCGPTR